METVICPFCKEHYQVGRVIEYKRFICGNCGRKHIFHNGRLVPFSLLRRKDANPRIEVCAYCKNDFTLEENAEGEYICPFCNNILYILQNEAPFIFAAPGGLYVRLNSTLLKEIRESEGISLGTLAEIAGVSRRTIQMYETGMGAMIDAALRLEEFLNTPIIEPVDPFEYEPENIHLNYELKDDRKSGSMILDHLLEMGFSVTPVTRSPFEALTRNKDVIILTGLDSQDQRIIQKAILASDISRLVGRHSLIIVEKKPGMDNVGSTALVSKDELKRMDDKNELTDMVMSRSGSQ